MDKVKLSYEQAKLLSKYTNDIVPIIEGMRKFLAYTIDNNVVSTDFRLSIMEMIVYLDTSHKRFSEQVKHLIIEIVQLMNNLDKIRNE